MAREGKRKKTAQGKEAAGALPRSAVPAAHSTRGAVVVICVVLAVVTLVLYGRVNGYDFINFDDGDYVLENDHVKQGLTWEGIRWAFTGTQVANWHPITTLSLLLNSQLFGLGAGTFHSVNVLFHVANTVLIFLLLRHMTGAVWRSAVVAALFAWHPLHVESVAWVSERKDVLSGFFGLLTLWAYVRFVEQPKAARHVLALVCFALGLMSKPMLVTLPFVLLLLDYWPLRRMKPPLGDAVNGKSPGRLLWEKAPFFALCALGSAITFLTQKHTGAVATTEYFPLGERMVNAMVSYARYVEKAFWPVNLAVFYPYPRGWPVWRVSSAVLLLAVVSGAVIWFRRRRPYLMTGWCLFLGMLVPVIGLVQVGSQSMADRYTYLPLLGVFIMLAWGGGELAAAGQPWKFIVPAVTVAALVGCLAVGWRQIGRWQDSLTLFEHTIAVTTRNEFAHVVLGQALEGRGKPAEAAPHYLEAIRIQPKNFDAHFYLGSALAKQGKADEAMTQFLEVLRLRPDHFEAHYNLAGLLFQGGRLDEAEAQYTAAERLKPGSADCQSNLALTLMVQEKLDAAAEHFNRALRINPEHLHARVNLGYTLSRLRKSAEAVAQFRETLRRAPDFTLAIYRLSWLLATDEDPKFRDGAEAVRLAERGLALSGGNDASLLEALAAAHAEAGHFEEAVRTQQLAIHGATGREPAQTVSEMNQRLALYRNQTAYHAPAR